MRFVTAISNNEWFFFPALGLINEKGYYGYTVIAIGFAWLRFRCKVEFGVKKVRNKNAVTRSSQKSAL